MDDKTLQPVTGGSSATVTVTPESSARFDNLGQFGREDWILQVVKDDNRLAAFVGAVKSESLQTFIRTLDGSREKMLVDAVNNRTRERNYYQLYSRLLENEITDDEFDRAIDENPDDYVVSTDKIPTEQEFHDAIVLADYIKGVSTSGDIETLFSFRGKEFNEYCKKLLDGKL